MYKPVKTKTTSSGFGFQLVTVTALVIAPFIAAAVLFSPGCQFQISGFNFRGEQAKKSETGEIASDLRTIEIINKHGDVHVSHQSDLNWKWDLTTWASTEEQAKLLHDQIKMNVSQVDGGKQIWELTFPDDMSKCNGVQSNLTLGVPKNVQVVTTNRHGNTQLAEISGDVKIVSGHGDIASQNTSGSVEVESKHGDVSLTGTGATKLKSQHGDVKVMESSGEVSISCQHGDVIAKTVEGSVAISCGHGDCTLTSIMGDATVDVRHGDIELECKGEKIKCEHTHGDSKIVVLNGSAKSVDVRGQHGDIVVSLPDSSTPKISAETKHGDVHNEFDSNTTGDLVVNLRTSFDDIRITKHSNAK